MRHGKPYQLIFLLPRVTEPYNITSTYRHCHEHDHINILHKRLKNDHPVTLQTSSRIYKQPYTFIHRFKLIITFMQYATCCTKPLGAAKHRIPRLHKYAEISGTK